MALTQWAAQFSSTAPVQLAKLAWTHDGRESIRPDTLDARFCSATRQSVGIA